MQNKVNRIYYMDPMRAVLMMLGVLLHSLVIYDPSKRWLIWDNNTIDIVEHLKYIIHIFRMPAFFVVSGFFCFLTLKKYDTKKFFSLRLKRILIPFIVTALTLNSLQTLILTATGYREFDIYSYISQGQWVTHLWFLINIFIYFLIAGVIKQIYDQFFSNLKLSIIKPIHSLPIFIIFAILPIFSFFVLLLGKIGIPIYSKVFIFDVYLILSYSPYFIFGVILAINKKLMEKFTNCLIPTTIALIFILAIKYWIHPQTPDELDNLNFYFDSLISWLLVSLCFSIFKVFFNKPTKIGLILSDASYTVYLFHHVIVIVLGIASIKLGISGYLGIPLIVIISFLCTFFIHLTIIKRFDFASLLFNGKANK